MNCTETKKRIIVGNRDRVIKARTNLVLSFAPIMFFLLSKSSLTKFRPVRKRRRRSNITLIFMRAKTRMLLENGSSSPRLKTRNPR